MKNKKGKIGIFMFALFCVASFASFYAYVPDMLYKIEIKEINAKMQDMENMTPIDFYEQEQAKLVARKKDIIRKFMFFPGEENGKIYNHGAGSG